MSDYFPSWLSASPQSQQQENLSQDEIHVEVIYDPSHPSQTPKKNRWTIGQLKAKKARLEKQLEKERRISSEIEQLHQECLGLAEERERLRSIRTSIKL